MDTAVMNLDLCAIVDPLQTALDISSAIKQGSTITAASKSLRVISLKFDALPNDMFRQNVQTQRSVTSSKFKGTYMCTQNGGLKVLRIQFSPFDNNAEKMSRVSAPRRFYLEVLIWSHSSALPCPGTVEGPMTGSQIPSVCLISFRMDNGNTEDSLAENPTLDRLNMVREIMEDIADGTQKLTRMSTELSPPSDDRALSMFGCVVVEMYSGTHLFPDSQRYEQLFRDVVYQKHGLPAPQQPHEESWATVESSAKYDTERLSTANDVFDMLRAFVSSTVSSPSRLAPPLTVDKSTTPLPFSDSSCDHALPLDSCAVKPLRAHIPKFIDHTPYTPKLQVQSPTAVSLLPIAEYGLASDLNPSVDRTTRKLERGHSKRWLSKFTLLKRKAIVPSPSSIISVVGSCCRCLSSGLRAFWGRCSGHCKLPFTLRPTPETVVGEGEDVTSCANGREKTQKPDSEQTGSSMSVAEDPSTHSPDATNSKSDVQADGDGEHEDSSGGGINTEQLNASDPMVQLYPTATSAEVVSSTCLDANRFYSPVICQTKDDSELLIQEWANGKLGCVREEDTEVGDERFVVYDKLQWNPLMVGKDAGNVALDVGSRGPLPENHFHHSPHGVTPFPSDEANQEDRKAKAAYLALPTHNLGVEPEITGATPSISWNTLNKTLPGEIRRDVESIIRQPTIKPWADVVSINTELYQPVMDALQAALDGSLAMESGFERKAAIKTLQAVSRISGQLPSEMVLRNVRLDNMTFITGGGFSDIYVGFHQSQKVCMKVLRLYTSDDHSGSVAQAFRQEALLWRQLRHPRILRLLGIGVDMSPSFCMISPWMENGNIVNFLQLNPKHDRLKMLLEIVEGIEYLHTHDPTIVHADIRAANILVQDDLTCCLTDFGLTMAIETQAPSTTSRLGRGATHWMPPEAWQYRLDAYIPARDIYSFGCTVIEIYSGRPPFPDIKRDAAVLYEVVYKKCKPPCPEEMAEAALWVIVKLCLEYESRARPAANQVYAMLVDLQDKRRSNPCCSIQQYS